MSTYTIVRETLHSSVIRACRKQKSFELSFKTGSVSDGLNMTEYNQVNCSMQQVPHNLKARSLNFDAKADFRYERRLAERRPGRVALSAVR